MSNIQLNGAKLVEDTEMAKSIIEGKVAYNRYTFHTYSRIFRASNENMSHEAYVNALKDKKRVLSVSASGDQIINSILLGGEDITGIDICNFPKYLVALKLAALQALDKDEFILYILGNDERPPFSRKIYEKKVRDNLDEISRSFWDSLFTYYRGRKIFSSKFFYDSYNMPEFEVIQRNPYLQGDNFEKVKEKITQASIQLFDKNMFSISESDFGEFDLIMLSNVLNYIDDDEIKLAKKMAKDHMAFFKRLPLKEGGVAVSYNMICNGFTKFLLSESGIDVYKVKEFLAIGMHQNEIITYQKKR